MDPDIELVERIRPVVTSHVRRTPILRSEWLGVHLKCENLQITGSFKVRGGFGAVSEIRGPVVASSAGNHGQGLALAAKTFGVPCTIVVPKSIPSVKEEAIRSHGARVVKSPFDGYDDTQSWTLERLGEFGGEFVSPFEHPAVIAGNGGTTALEIFEECPDLDTLVIPCGGGGCAAGAGIAARARSPKTRIIGVNTDASPGMWLSRRDGRVHLKIESAPTIAEGLEGGVGEDSFRLGLRYIDDVVVVKEATVRRAVAEIARRERMVVEGSGAAGVAAILEGRVTGGRIGVVLTGANIEPGLLAELLAGP